MAQFSPGDVVVLRSGSVPFTVEAVTTDGKLNVRWFHDWRTDKDGNLLCWSVTQGLPAVCFKHYNEPQLKVKK